MWIYCHLWSHLMSSCPLHQYFTVLFLSSRSFAIVLLGDQQTSWNICCVIQRSLVVHTDDFVHTLAMCLPNGYYTALFNHQYITGYGFNLGASTYQQIPYNSACQVVMPLNQNYRNHRTNYWPFSNNEKAFKMYIQTLNPITNAIYSTIFQQGNVHFNCR